MLKMAASLCACLAIAGCLRETSEPTAARKAAGSSLVLSAPVNVTGDFAREPMVVEHPNGALFVAGYGNPLPRLWRSGDGGTTWSTVDVGSEADGAAGNSDVDLAVARDGTLYFVAMTFDRAKGEGTRIAIGVTRDAGTTWAWTTLSQTRYDDRPWVEVAPDGTAHVIWNDGNGVSYARSRDGGRTWQERPRIHPQGLSSHLTVGPSGEVAVRITPVSASGNRNHPAVDLVAVSRDAGVTWVKHPAPGQRVFTFPFDDNDPTFRWVEPLAWDSAGRLYYFWTDPAGLWLAGSIDSGAQWRTWQIAEGGEHSHFPYLVARGAGQLAATWFSGRREHLQIHVARIDLTGAESPKMTVAPPFSPDSWQRGQKPGEPRHRDAAGEYAPVAFLRDGRIAVVSTIQDDQQKRFGFSWRTGAAR